MRTNFKAKAAGFSYFSKAVFILFLLLISAIITSYRIDEYFAHGTITPYVPWTEWSQTYGGTSDDYSNILIQTSDGGYALAGYTNSYGAGGSDAWIVKTDSSGNMQWSKTYGGTSNDVALCIIQTSDGGYALAGYTNSYGAGGSDAWIVKTDSSGNMQWSKTYGGTSNDGASCIIQTSDGGYALAGTTSDSDAWLIRINAAGNLLWNKTYAGNYGFTSLVKVPSGGYALGGTAPPDKPSVGAALTFYLVRTDESGNMLWYKKYDHHTVWQTLDCLITTADGGYMLAGKESTSHIGDCWLVKTDGSGNVMWNYTYGMPNLH